MLSRGDIQIRKVTLGQTDLEDVFVEFAKSEENPDIDNDED